MDDRVYGPCASSLVQKKHVRYAGVFVSSAGSHSNPWRVYVVVPAGAVRRKKSKKKKIQRIDLPPSASMEVAEETACKYIEENFEYWPLKRR